MAATTGVWGTNVPYLQVAKNFIPAVGLYFCNKGMDRAVEGILATPGRLEEARSLPEPQRKNLLMKAKELRLHSSCAIGNTLLTMAIGVVPVAFKFLSPVSPINIIVGICLAGHTYECFNSYQFAEKVLAKASL